jgi:hypothetical protein
MQTEPALGKSAGGLQTAIDILVSPREAFARLRETPTWGWAYLIAVLLSIIGTLAITPALKHAMEAGMPAVLAASPQIAKLPPDQQQQAIAQGVSIQVAIVNFTWLFTVVVVPFIVAVQSVVMLIANQIGRGDGNFRRFFALAMNVQIAGAVGGLIVAAIVLLRGATSFTEPAQLQGAMPNLGMLAPGGPHVLVAFLGGINVVGLWQCALLAYGMMAVAKISRPVAWTTAAVMLLSIAVLAAIGAAAQPHG